MKNHSRTALEALVELREAVYDDADVRVRALIDEAIEALEKQVPREAAAVDDEDRDRFGLRALMWIGKVAKHLPWIVALLDRFDD